MSNQPRAGSPRWASPRWARFVAVALVALAAVGCATVPKEVVELSYTVGRDLDAVHLSYAELVREHFAHLRRQAREFIDVRWTPAFLKEFIRKGELMEAAKLQDPQRAFEGVQDWTEAALEQIATRKQELLAPIEADEAALLATVDEAFGNLMRSNATITAHLNSLREVQEVQDEALQTLKVRDLRDKVKGALALASERAGAALSKLKDERPQ